MHWCFRAVKNSHGVSIKHLYIDKGTVVSWSDTPYIAEAETLESLQSALALILSEILSHPAIDESELHGFKIPRRQCDANDCFECD